MIYRRWFRNAVLIGGLYGLVQLYRYFSYWGLGVGIILLVITTLVFFIASIVSVVLKNRRLFFESIKNLLIRFSKTRFWQGLEKMLQRRLPRIYRWARSTIDVTTVPGISLTIGIIVSLIFLILFLGVAVDVIFNIDIARADVRIIYFLRTVISGQATAFFIFFTHLADIDTVFIIFGAVSLYLLLLRQYRWIAYLTLSVSSGEVLSAVTKWLFARARPASINLIHLPWDPSFPSGHALIAVCLYGFLTFLLFRKSGRRIGKIAVVALAALLIILIGTSRIYLGVHYPTDVFGGWYLGLGILTLVITFFEVERKFHFTGLVAVKNYRYSKKFQFYYLSILLIGIGIFLIWNYNRTDIVAIQESTQPVATIATFVSQANHYSENLVGRHMAPMSFIVIGSREQLVNAFRAAGWHEADLPSVKNFFRLYSRIAKDTQYPSGPMTPAFYKSRTNDLGFEKETALATSRQRHHTRYWDSGYRLHGEVIWVATASLDEAIGIGSVIKLPTHKIDPDIDIEREFIAKDLIGAHAIETYSLIDMVGAVTGTNAAGDPFVTDGKAYVLYLR